MSVAIRMHPEKPLPPADIIARLRALGTSLLSDVMDRWPGAPGLLPVGGPGVHATMAGTAMTARTRAGDNLVVHAALELVRPGEVIVVAAGGATDRAILGGIMATYARHRGAAGLVVDGAIRDVLQVRDHGPPTFAKGVCHLGPYRSGPGELRCPVAVAGVVVHDGDYVIGDADGVAIVPRDRIDDVLQAAEAKGRYEQQELADIASGTWDRRWVFEAVDLRRDGR
jgi:regulator of RNase E activity RraA